jgi:Cys-tRNA(Pro)/Cys-tRNA(Cys) deacylase
MTVLLPERLAAFIADHRIAVQVETTGEAAPTAVDAARILGVTVSAIVKTMVLTDGECCVAAIVAGDERLDRRKVAGAVGAGTLRFAKADEVISATGYPPGGVAPFGFAGAVTVVVDAALAREPEREIIAGGGRPELLLRLTVRDLLRATQATVASIVLERR